MGRYTDSAPERRCSRRTRAVSPHRARQRIGAEIRGAWPQAAPVSAAPARRYGGLAAVGDGKVLPVTL
ncbi:MAG: hypothetical protein FWD58_04990 [Firmicutes bacterium]|nr:hypothetical protein [Bacillota bacterium]